MVTFLNRFTFALIDMSFARILFYESVENLLSFARFNCALFYLLLQVTWTFNR